MYTNEELHKLIEGALQGFIPDQGQVYTVTMTPVQRECLLHVLDSSPAAGESK